MHGNLSVYRLRDRAAAIRSTGGFSAPSPQDAAIARRARTVDPRAGMRGDVKCEGVTNRPTCDAAEYTRDVHRRGERRRELSVSMPVQSFSSVAAQVRGLPGAGPSTIDATWRHERAK